MRKKSSLFPVPSRKAGCPFRAVLAVAAALWGLFGPSPLWAAPADPFPFGATQPDGTRIVLRQRGDEFFHWTETTGGYALVRDAETGYWEYAVLSGDLLRASGRAYRAGTAPVAGAVRNLVPSKTQIREGLRFRSENASRGGWPPKPVSGTRSILLIRVGFANRSLSIPASHWATKFFGETDSVARYYADQSAEALTVQAALKGEDVLTVNMTKNDVNGGRHPYGFIDKGTDETKHANEVALVTAVLRKAAAQGVDFSEWDENKDGKIAPDELCVYLIVAGFEEGSGAGKPTPCVWAHAWASWSGYGAAHQVSISGKILTDWAMNGELRKAGSPLGIGVAVHELGHQFGGLPDLYDTADRNSGVGAFSVMGSGCWGALSGDESGTTPVNLDAWSRYFLGWETPATPSSGTATLGVPGNGTNPALKLLSPTHRGTEYFLAEVRAPSGWDRGLQASGFSKDDGGLLILHVDESVGRSGWNDFNTYVKGKHQGCLVEEADGPHLSKTDGSATEGSPQSLWYKGNPSYVGEGVFDGSGDPDSRFYDGTASGVSLREISASGTRMTCKVVSGGAGPTAAPTETPEPAVSPLPTGEARPTPAEEAPSAAAQLAPPRISGTKTVTERDIAEDPYALQICSQAEEQIAGQDTSFAEAARQVLSSYFGTEDLGIAAEPEWRFTIGLETPGSTQTLEMEGVLSDSEPGWDLGLFLLLPTYDPKNGSASRDPVGFELVLPVSEDWGEEGRTFSYSVSLEDDGKYDRDGTPGTIEVDLNSLIGGREESAGSGGGGGGCSVLPVTGLLLLLPLFGLLGRREVKAPSRPSSPRVPDGFARRVESEADEAAIPRIDRRSDFRR
jgi:M6 family metalloprotease-like protein